MFGKNIKELRLERDMSQKMLAEKIGVTQGAVFFWEKEINEPTVGYIIKLAQIFQVSVDELLSYEIDKNDAENGKRTEIISVFDRLNEKQQDLLICLAREMLNK